MYRAIRALGTQIRSDSFIYIYRALRDKCPINLVPGRCRKCDRLAVRAVSEVAVKFRLRISAL